MKDFESGVCTLRQGFGLRAQHRVSKPLSGRAKSLNPNDVFIPIVEHGAMKRLRKLFSVLDIPQEERKNVEARFWQRVEKTDGCWNWKGFLRPDGYGIISIRHFTRHHILVRVHRVSYELIKGRIPEGMILDHLCRNRLCVNPDHLEPVTNKENLLRGETVYAINARKTHCPWGHPLSGDNLAEDDLRKGKRHCKICRNAQRKERMVLKDTIQRAGLFFPVNGWNTARILTWLKRKGERLI